MTIDEAIALVCRQAMESVSALEAEGLDLRNPEHVPPAALFADIGNGLEHLHNHIREAALVKRSGGTYPAEEVACTGHTLRGIARVAILMWAASEIAAAEAAPAPPGLLN